MEDSSPMQESGTTNDLNLKVNTSSLERVLISIHQSIQCHENALTKLPQVEANQTELRKELKKLQLALESIGEGNSGENNGSVGDNADDNNDTDTNNSYGIRTCDIEPIYRKHSQASSNDGNKSITNSLREVKSAIRKVQDESSVNSTELEEGIKSLKDTLFEIQQKLATSVSVEQLQTLQRNLFAKYSQLENNTQDIQTNLHNEIESSTSSCNGQIKDLEVAVKQRHTKLEQIVSSCAKELDVADLKESLESDIASLSRTLTFLDDTAKAQGKTLVSVQQKNAIAMFHRHYTQWKQKQLLVGLSRWKKVVQRQKKLELNKEKQKSQVRKTLTNIISRRKRIGFDKWIRFRDWHRNVEQKKLQATTMICERLGNYLSASKIMAFNKWRRVTLMDKMKCSRDAVAVDMTISESTTTSTIISTSVKSVDLDSILDAFGSDVQGATYALASEIQSTHADIASLRQHWCDETQRLMSNIKTSMDEAIRGVEDAADTFQESITLRVDSCANELPVVHSKLKELSQIFESNKSNLNQLEKDHRQRIDSLVKQEQQLTQRLSDVEASAKTAHNDVTYLFEEQAKSDKSIQELRDIVAKNDHTRHEEHNLFQQALDHFGDELLKTKVTLGHTRVRCESVEKELVDTKSELNHLQHACQVESERTQSQLHHPGIPKPSLDRIVGVGHAFESLAQDKNYVTSINVCATLRTTSCSKMTTKGEQVRHDEEVDVPSEIVAFAHDYAAFVAYQADHESILRLIAGGSNLDDQVYAEDDMLNRRKELCSELRHELETLLEKSSTSVFYVKNEGSSRGLGLRWEARAVFLPKVVSSLEAALSKHDQILLPAATRLGRVRPLSANVTVCVACDRPLRRKTARTPADGEKRKKKTDKKEDIDDNNVEVEESLEGLEVGTASKVGEVQGSTGQIIKKSGLANAHKENSNPSNFFDDLVTFN